MNIDNIRHVLLERRKQKGLSAQKLGEKVGVDKTTIYRYEKGQIEKMPLTIANKLSDALDIDPAFIAGFSNDPYKNVNTILSRINVTSKKLEKIRQKVVLRTAEKQLQEQEQEQEQTYNSCLNFCVKEKIPTIYNSASAANPTELVYGDTVIEEEEFEDVPYNADFAVPIKGDSMSSKIEDGDIVFVHRQSDIEDGEIAIVEIDGEGVTCKVVFKDYDNKVIILHSINEKYPDREIEPNRVKIIGKVVS